MEPVSLGEENYPVTPVGETLDENKVTSDSSAENFQKTIYELFNNNGILSDLRAYLRGHIVNVLKSAQNGSVPPISRNFKQRLELPNQALNMLIAEYFVCMEFNYSLSVFVSELPLPNMIFDYAQDLLQNSYDETLRFKQKDISAILTYLGVKCDSHYITNMLEMYESNPQAPLLMCMFKCLGMHDKKAPVYEIESVEDMKSIVSSDSRSVGTLSPRSTSPKRCRHHRKCRRCQSRLLRMREKMRQRKRASVQNKYPGEKEKEADSLMKQINAMEGSLMEEMFDQLKEVYETEVEMVKSEEEKRIRMTLAAQALQLQKKQDEMEEEFKARAEELERSVQQKKKFLWSLARALRDQHKQMSRAMRNVKCDSQRLSAKEESLKSQLLETEEILSRRGEEIRKQISSELLTLEAHINAMKLERVSIDKEKSELEQLRSAYDMHLSNSYQQNFNNQYDNLRKELEFLKSFITNRFDKTVVDGCTNTENYKFEVLNNEDEDRVFDRAIRGPQLYNDFKKFKNVNFSFDKLDRRRPGLQTSQSADTKVMEIAQLREENEKLKRSALALKQGEEMRAIRDGSTYKDWKTNVSPQVCVPEFPSNDSFPDCDAIGDMYSNKSSPDPSKAGSSSSHTRHLLNQWRTLKHRTSPSNKICKRFTSNKERPKSANANLESHQSRIESTEFNKPYAAYHQCTAGTSPHRVSPPTLYDDMRQREKSPKSLLREAKEKLRSKDNIKTAFLTKNPRDKSPSSVLKEAKKRLRKLEIEAEAVEKSYLNFRKRQSMMREGVEMGSEEGIVTKDVGSTELSKHSAPLRQRYESTRNSEAMNMYNKERADKNDFEQYLIKKFETGFKKNERFMPKTSTDAAKPIPDAYKEDTNRKTENFIDKPLPEFRKLYQSNINEIQVNPAEEKEKSVPDIALENLNKRMEQINNDGDFVKNPNPIANTKNQEVSVESKQFKAFKKTCPHEPEKLSNNAKENVPGVVQITPDTDKKLRIEVETTSVNNLQESSDDVFLVVSAHSRAEKISETESDCTQINTNMTILISPKRSIFKKGERVDVEIFKKSLDEQSRLARNEVLGSIYRNDTIDNDLDVESLCEEQKELSPIEYPDDFSGDIDFFNNSSSDQSPISNKKSSDEDNFWDA